MVVPPSLEELKTRLVGRHTETEKDIKLRMDRIEYELSKSKDYDYVVMNDDVINAVEKIEKIIIKEKNKQVGEQYDT